MTAIITKSSQEAAAALRAGKLVAIPTETVYGLGANALDEAAAARIFAAKNRPSFDPLIIHQSSAERILAYAREVPPEARILAEHFWPGPLTMVLPKIDTVPDLITAGLPTIALRVPAHPLTRDLLSRVDFPVAAPSANPFGFVSPTTAGHVFDQLGDRIDYILDGGPCAVGLESTIVGFPGGVATVLRKGGLPVEQIESLLGHPLAVKTHGSSRPEAPGMLSRHYSPGNRMELFGRIAPDTAFPAGTALLLFGKKDHHQSLTDGRVARVFNLSPAGDLTEAARQLFHFLRLISREGYAYVAAEYLPEEGLGRAINDRLRRAAATE